MVKKQGRVGPGGRASRTGFLRSRAKRGGGE